jgi:hypothetical protein
VRGVDAEVRRERAQIPNRARDVVARGAAIAAPVVDRRECDSLREKRSDDAVTWLVRLPITQPPPCTCITTGTAVVPNGR